MYNEADPEILQSGKIPADVEEQCWLIFRFFVCPNSIYECGMGQHRRKEIMHHLAYPTKEIFDSLEKNIHLLVRNQYIDYSFTKEFANIPSIINAAIYEHHFLKRAEKEKRELEKFEAKERERRQKELDASCLGIWLFYLL
jgi:hypothetical protein